MTAGATASSPGDKTLTLSVPAFSLSRSENPAASPLTQIRSNADHFQAIQDSLLAAGVAVGEGSAGRVGGGGREWRSRSVERER